MGSSTIARGIKAARTLKDRRRSQRWADKDYKKRNLGEPDDSFCFIGILGNKWKCDPFVGAPMAKGIVTQRFGVEAKQPNSAIRKCVRVQLIRSGKVRIIQFINFQFLFSPSPPSSPETVR